MNATPNPRRTRIIAHRGDSHAAPENTLAAFRSAIACGADGVEFDVQLSRDGVPVVIHDERLERTTTGTGWVREHCAAELIALQAGHWFDPPVHGEPVPTLAAVLGLLAPTALELHLELKTGIEPYPGLAAAVLSVMAATRVESRVIISSFNHYTLREVRQLAPHVPCAALLYDKLVRPWDYVQHQGFQGLHPHHRLVDEEMVQGCARGGLALRTYTVDAAEEAQRLLDLRLDGIMTNEPARLMRLRDASDAS